MGSGSEYDFEPLRKEGHMSKLDIGDTNTKPAGDCEYSVIQPHVKLFLLPNL